METTENKKSERRSLNDEFLGFRGSEEYFQYSSLFPDYYITQGVKHIIDKCGLCWFLDVVLSYQIKKIVKSLHFQTWKLERQPEGSLNPWKVVLYDSDAKKILSQNFKMIDLTDNYEENFDVFKIYLANKIAYLPTEE